MLPKLQLIFNYVEKMRESIWFPLLECVSSDISAIITAEFVDTDATILKSIIDTLNVLVMSQFSVFILALSKLTLPTFRKLE